jgi:hypothetical protein
MECCEMFNPKEVQKWETENNKERRNRKQIMLNLNPSISIITLNINGTNMPIKGNE